MGQLLGREHDSTPQSGVEAPRLLKNGASPDCTIAAVAVAVVAGVAGAVAAVAADAAVADAVVLEKGSNARCVCALPR